MWVAASGTTEKTNQLGVMGSTTVHPVLRTWFLLSADDMVPAYIGMVKGYSSSCEVLCGLFAPQNLYSWISGRVSLSGDFLTPAPKTRGSHPLPVALASVTSGSRGTCAEKEEQHTIGFIRKTLVFEFGVWKLVHSVCTLLSTISQIPELTPGVASVRLSARTGYRRSFAFYR